MKIKSFLIIKILVPITKCDTHLVQQGMWCVNLVNPTSKSSTFYIKVFSLTFALLSNCKVGAAYRAGGNALWYESRSTNLGLDVEVFAESVLYNCQSCVSFCLERNYLPSKVGLLPCHRPEIYSCHKHNFCATISSSNLTA